MSLELAIKIHNAVNSKLHQLHVEFTEKHNTFIDITSKTQPSSIFGVRGKIGMPGISGISKPLVCCQDYIDEIINIKSRIVSVQEEIRKYDQLIAQEQNKQITEHITEEQRMKLLALAKECGVSIDI